MADFVATAAPVPAVSLNEIKAAARVTTSEEDALLAGLVRSATDLCERFTGTVLIARDVIEIVPASMAWARLGATPVRAIETVGALGNDGVETVLPTGSYALDIDAAGDGWVRLTTSRPERRLKVSYVAGLASEPNEIPDALRHGIARLALHSFARRDEAEPQMPPAAVTALWRPWRRLRLG